MPSLDTLLAFLGIAVLVTLAPGPDNLMVVGQSLAHGCRSGLSFALGCASGCLTHIAWATLGVAALVRASPSLFMGIKLAGAAYLLWLGVHALRRRDGLRPAPGTPAQAWLHDLRRGFVANALNPKVGLFFLAFLPQFTDPERGSLSLQMLLLGLLFAAQTVVIFGAMALAAGAIGRELTRRPGLGPWLDRLCGTLFIGLALRLACADL
ncbi:LysE family translocator [Zoogloea sp.]|uniref:LysE family translocator n=1 Tax=Zoogloea sp. TaxID=49181 RepID=UPI002609B81B|nr:LysE family translocator [Zoogloea sp.]MDD3352482.1 LysE family translocator [Zoogloea sp.]